MKKYTHELTTEHLLRVICTQKKIRKILLKSILACGVIESTRRTLIDNKLHAFTRLQGPCRQNTRCLITARARGVVTPTGLSRHTLKR